MNTKSSTKLKSFIAYTNEIDDVNAAVNEILTQLDFCGTNKLLKNTVGIVSCYSEYLESGVLAALCGKLPFEVVGSTTIANMADGQLGETMLCLLVLTSDELCFATSLSAPILCENNIAMDALDTLYNQALEKLPGKPSLLLSFAPLLKNFSSDFYMDCMTEISGNVPNFGSLAVDHNADYHDSQVIFCGVGYLDRFAVILIYGQFEPAFYIGTISNEKVFADKSVVTGSEGNFLRTVDGIPAISFIESLGLKRNADGDVVGINSFPIIVDYNDGTAPAARAMIGVTPDGDIVCGGNIPVGATLSVGSFDESEIVATSCRTLEKALNTGKHKIMLMYSCIGRYFSQGYNATAEFQALLEPLAKSGSAYMAAYSGGELCPVYGKDAKLINRNHNNTFIICGL